MRSANATEASDPSKGGHSVVLHGWGEESGAKYWIGRNSWGTGWGEEGLFRILRGENHLGIETGVSYQDGDPLKVYEGGECVKVKQHASGCSLQNTGCPGHVVSVKVMYKGTPGKCGSFSVTKTLHGDREPMEIDNGLICRVAEEKVLRMHDAVRHYVDESVSFPGWGCVIKAKYEGKGKRKLCCGQSCVSWSSGFAAPSQDFCSCPEAGGLWEKTEL